MKRGYKQTEVGVIPEHWELARLSALVATGPKNGYSGRSGKDARGTATLSLGATSSGCMLLNEETVKRLDALARRVEDTNPKTRRIRTDRKPIAGTRLLREFQGVEHIVTVTVEGYEYRGRPYKSLSAIAKAITGVKWNGWVFFGLKSTGSGT